MVNKNVCMCLSSLLLSNWLKNIREYCPVTVTNYLVNYFTLSGIYIFKKKSKKKKQSPVKLWSYKYGQSNPCNWPKTRNNSVSNYIIKFRLKLRIQWCPSLNTPSPPLCSRTLFTDSYTLRDCEDGQKGLGSPFFFFKTQQTTWSFNAGMNRLSRCLKRFWWGTYLHTTMLMHCTGKKIIYTLPALLGHIKWLGRPYLA